jgi:hypothetical protein
LAWPAAAARKSRRSRATREAARQVPLTVITVHQPVVVYLHGALDPDEDQALSAQVRKAARGQTTKVLDRRGARQTAASLMAHSRAWREWSDPSIPTMIPGILLFSLR